MKKLYHNDLTFCYLVYYHDKCLRYLSWSRIQINITHNKFKCCFPCEYFQSLDEDKPQGWTNSVRFEIFRSFFAFLVMNIDQGFLRVTKFAVDFMMNVTFPKPPITCNCCGLFHPIDWVGKVNEHGGSPLTPRCKLFRYLASFSFIVSVSLQPSFLGLTMKNSRR